MMDYTQITKDTQFATKIVNALTKESYGSLGNLLGSNPTISEFGGKWNDDMLWYSIPVMTGAEIFGKDTKMPGGVSYLQLAVTTYDQVMSQWDNICGGGIFWIRSQRRSGKTRNNESYGYKSAITNAQAILHAAKLGVLTGDKKYFEDGDRIYKWMVSSGTISPSFDVYDGIDAAPDASRGQCARANLLLSYKSGMTSGALAVLGGATKNQMYIDVAQNIFRKGVQLFTQNGIIFDPCESENKCSINVSAPKGTLIRGWGMLYEFSTDASIKSQIKQLLQATVENMLKTCDANWNCGTDWIGGTPNASPNLHYQLNAMELMNAYYKTFFSGPVNIGGTLLAAPSNNQNTYVPPPPFGAADKQVGSVLCMIFLMTLWGLIL